MASDLLPISYVAGTAASITVVLGAARAYYARQRKKWTQEGAAAQRNTEALDRNAEALKANTRAIAALGEDLDHFADEVREELNGHNVRLGRVEDIVERPIRTRKEEDGL